MDEVDFLLTKDMLAILNDVLRKCPEQLSPECIYNGQVSGLGQLVPLPGSQQLKITDSYIFTKYTPGIIILNNYKIKKDPFVCILFKLDVAQIMCDCAAILAKDRNKQWFMDTVLMSMMQKYAPNAPQQLNGRNLDIKLKVRDKEGDRHGL